MYMYHSFFNIYIYIYIKYIIIEYGHEAKPCILELKIVLAAHRDDGYYDYDHRAR